MEQLSTHDEWTRNAILAAQHHKDARDIYMAAHDPDKVLGTATATRYAHNWLRNVEAIAGLNSNSTLQVEFPVLNVFYNKHPHDPVAKDHQVHPAFKRIVNKKLAAWRDSNYAFQSSDGMQYATEHGGLYWTVDGPKDPRQNKPSN